LDNFIGTFTSLWIEGQDGSFFTEENDYEKISFVLRVLSNGTFSFDRIREFSDERETEITTIDGNWLANMSKDNFGVILFRSEIIDMVLTRGSYLTLTLLKGGQIVASSGAQGFLGILPARIVVFSRATIIS
jgi:hypothetical protein